MAKRRLKIHFRIPEYVAPRNRWRLLIYEAARAAMESGGVTYRAEDPLRVDVVLYFTGRALSLHDVDNRLKDVLDALQGRMGGPKAIRTHAPLIPNDRQVFGVSVTKRISPPQGRGYGHVTVSRFRASARPERRAPTGGCCSATNGSPGRLGCGPTTASPTP